jgi:hypothetical protein
MTRHVSDSKRASANAQSDLPLSRVLKRKDNLRLKRCYGDVGEDPLSV